MAVFLKMWFQQVPSSLLLEPFRKNTTPLFWTGYAPALPQLRALVPPLEFVQPEPVAYKELS